MLLRLAASAALAMLATTAYAAEVLTGKDAAHIDLTVKNCGAKSTDKEHRLIDEANAKGRDAFLKAYAKEIASPKLTKALEQPAETKALCADMRNLYGDAGSKVAGLLVWPTEPAATDTSPRKQSAASEKAGKGRGGRGGGFPR